MTSEPASGERISFGRRLRMLAAAEPDAPAITFAAADGRLETWTRARIDRASDRLASRFLEWGVGPGSTVAIALPNCPEHAACALAGWKLGATVLPLSARLAPAERPGLLELARPALLLAEWPERTGVPTLSREELGEIAERGPVSALPDRVAHPGKAVASGGSTGRPKIIVDPAPWARAPGELARIFGAVGFRSGLRQLLAGPLYHNAPFLWLHYGLFEAGHVVLMERFDAARAVDLVERYRIEWTMLVPTMMGRIARLPDLGRRDLTSLEGVYHTAAPCPPWVKRAWIELIGAERVFEAYGSTENVGAAIIRGDEWLAHPGSVGRAFGCELRILDPEGHPLPPGAVGEIFSRPGSPEPFRYRGDATIRTADQGFASVGDLGWLDRDGYLYLADRRTDLIVTGGANVYPAEVEAVLTEHPSVADAVVVGRPDPDLGKRVHAVVVPAPGATVSVEALVALCRERLSPYKVPRTLELVAELPRNEAGKIRRDLLAAER